MKKKNSSVKCQISNMRAGFTLLEMLLSLSAITLIAGIGVPVYQSFQNRNNLDIAATTVVQNMRRAQVLSHAVDGDTSWGVKAQSGSIVMFKGASYVARDADFDEVFEVPTNMTVSGIGEYVFTKFTGLPASVGTTTLMSVNNETRTITINAKGTIEY
ncbi:MAG: prepilin-type N-terminal cleavage/methylation domain-containing protein [Patescibacteria group bacterium]|nr:prepilin-type N-terminal cleavage/methylation domain-containing protein [Patescibacteria group bacterium]